MRAQLRASIGSFLSRFPGIFRLFEPRQLVTAARLINERMCHRFAGDSSFNNACIIPQFQTSFSFFSKQSKTSDVGNKLDPRLNFLLYLPFPHLLVPSPPSKSVIRNKGGERSKGIRILHPNSSPAAEAPSISRVGHKSWQPVSL